MTRGIATGVGPTGDSVNYQEFLSGKMLQDNDKNGRPKV